MKNLQCECQFFGITYFDIHLIRSGTLVLPASNIATLSAFESWTTNNSQKKVINNQQWIGTAGIIF